VAVDVAEPPAVVTLIFTVAAAWALETAVTFVGDVTVKLVAAVVPNVTEVAPNRPVPVRVTEVPPLVVPAVGVKDVMVGVTLIAGETGIAARVPPVSVFSLVTKV
jgi:hypothetical protein